MNAAAINTVELRFRVFVHLITVTGQPGNWQAWLTGNEGKRRPAELCIPPDLQQHELQEYLADVFHEDATPRYNEVLLLSSE